MVVALDRAVFSHWSPQKQYIGKICAKGSSRYSDIEKFVPRVATGTAI
jgi:hypothetical protein